MKHVYSKGIGHLNKMTAMLVRSARKKLPVFPWLTIFLCVCFCFEKEPRYRIRVETVSDEDHKQCRVRGQLALGYACGKCFRERIYIKDKEIVHNYFPSAALGREKPISKQQSQRQRTASVSCHFIDRILK